MRNRAVIKAEAREFVRVGQISPVLVTLIFLVIGFAMSRLADLVSGKSLFYSLELQLAEMQGQLTGDYSLYDDLTDISPSLMGTFLSILVMLLNTVLHGGYCLFLMGIRRGETMPWSTLFDGFSRAGKLIWCQILMGIKIALWSFLFVIPGIIAAYRYRFAIYNILTDDSLSAGEAIRLSCRQTDGIKSELFVLDLSFIGWNLVSLLTLDLLQVWLTPYMVLSDLAYYDDACARLGGAGAEEQDNRYNYRDKDPWEY